jgi:dTDP-4-amino-4,6-dideoxygalactose transaminase
MRRLESQGIATRQGTHAVHLLQYYREKYDFQPMDLPASYAADRLTVALPFYPDLTEADIDYLFDALRSMPV